MQLFVIRTEASTGAARWRRKPFQQSSACLVGRRAGWTGRSDGAGRLGGCHNLQHAGINTITLMLPRVGHQVCRVFFNGLGKSVRILSNFCSLCIQPPTRQPPCYAIDVSGWDSDEVTPRPSEITPTHTAGLTMIN